MKNLTKIFLWFFVGLLSLGELQKTELRKFSFEFLDSSRIVSMYLSDIFLVVFNLFFITYFSYLIFYAKIDQTKIYLKSFFSSSFNLVLLLLTGYIFILPIQRMYYDSDLTQILYLLRLANIIIFSLAIYCLKKLKILDSKTLKAQILAFCFLLGYLGFGQLLFFGDTRFLYIFGYDDHLQRMIGTLFDPAFLGINLIFGFYISLFSQIPKQLKIFLLIFFSVAIFFTTSRATYLAFFLTSILAIWQHKLEILRTIKQHKSTFLAFSTLFLFAIIFMSFTFFTKNSFEAGEGRNILRTASIKARIANISHFVSTLNNRELLIGNGLFSAKNNVNYRLSSGQIVNENIVNNARVPDNIFINFVISLGVIPTLFILFIFYKFIIYLIKTKNHVVLYCFIALLVASQFNNTFFHYFTIINFLMINAGWIDYNYVKAKA